MPAARLAMAAAALVAVHPVAQPLRAQERSWMFGPFTKPVAANPVIVPDAASTFH